MKVVILGRYPTGRISGGVAVHEVNLINHLGKAGGKEHDIRMLSFGDSSHAIKDGNSEIRIMKIFKLYYLLPILPVMKLMHEIRKIDPDVLHLQGVNFSPYLIGMLLSGKKRKKAITLHSYPTRELVAHNELEYNTPKYFFLRWMERAGINVSDRLICVSTSLKEWALGEQKTGEPDKAVVVLNGVDLELFKPVSKTVARQDLGIPDGDFVIFHAKAFVAKNGQIYLIKAMPEILKHIPRAKLYLAGEGPLKPEIEKLADELHIRSHVVFPGDLPNAKVPGYLAASDIVCLPSIYTEGLEEASSIFLVEAMAMEKPCIASNIGGLTESIKNENNGLLIPDKDEAAIAAAVIRLYDDTALANSIGKNARRYVEQERSWEAVAAEHLRLYKSMIN